MRRWPPSSKLMGVASADAAEGADVLVMTDLRGVETHGVSDMLSTYVDQYSRGVLNPSPNCAVLRESPATATIDADHGLGSILGRQTMDLAIEKARTVGVGHFAMMAVQRDMVGVCITAVGRRVEQDPARRKTGGRSAARLGRRHGRQPHPGGTARASQRRVLRPADRWHQGAGFTQGLWVQPHVRDPWSAVVGLGAKHVRQRTLREYVQELLCNLRYLRLYQFKDRMDQMLQILKETKLAPGQERVMYPGLAEHEEEAERRANGIPLHKEVVQWFDDIAGELAVPPLGTM